MTEKSAKYTVDPDYLKSRPFIDSQKRSVLLDWMLEVAHAFQVGRDTYHMAANYVDRYLANSWGIRPESLQLLAITCLFIAAKIEEVNPPQAILYAEATDNTFCAQDIVDFEGQILDTLQWNLLPDTVIAWVKYYTARSVSLVMKSIYTRLLNLYFRFKASSLRHRTMAHLTAFSRFLTRSLTLTTLPESWRSLTLRFFIPRFSSILEVTSLHLHS
jgi:hypothetical protein